MSGLSMQERPTGMAPPSEDGLLTQRRVESGSTGQTIDGKIRNNVDDLVDIRKHLMVMGLFPPDLYTVGESFEETRLR